MKGPINLSSQKKINSFLKDYQRQYQGKNSPHGSRESVSVASWQSDFLKDLVISKKNHQSYLVEGVRTSAQSIEAIDTPLLSSGSSKNTDAWVPNASLSKALVKYEELVRFGQAAPLESLWRCDVSQNAYELPMLLINGVTVSLSALHQFQPKDRVQLLRKPWEAVSSFKGINDLFWTCFYPYPEYRNPYQLSQSIGATETCLNADLLSVLLTYSQMLATQDNEHSHYSEEVRKKLLNYLEELGLWRRLYKGEMVVYTLLVLSVNQFLAPETRHSLFGLERMFVGLLSLVIGLGYFDPLGLDTFILQIVSFVSIGAIDLVMSGFHNDTLLHQAGARWVLASCLHDMLLLSVCAASYVVAEDIVRLNHLKLETDRCSDLINQIHKNADTTLVCANASMQVPEKNCHFASP